MAIEKEILGLEVVVEGLKKFQADMDKTDKAVGESAGRWGKLGGAAQGAGKILSNVAKVGLAAVATGAAAAVAGVGALVVGIGKLALEAAPIQGVKNAFEGLTESFEGGSAAMLAALKESSAGMITNRDLMMSFNTAAQLVSKDFAKQLPDAMQYLSKVAAATGQDMGYMMDSMVRGVGRLSPMILDNLGIQVDLTEATAAYAKELGVEASELTKTQQQAALMNQVLAKLAINTADMPDATGSAAATMAELKATIQDTKDAIGMAFLPALQELMKPLAELAQDLGPQIIAWAREAGIWLGENLPPAIESVRMGLAEIGQFITETAIPAFEAIVGWLKENFEPILAGLAAILLVVVVPAFIAWASAAISAAVATIAALAPVLVPILAIGAVVGLLAQAWKKDWGGIQTKARRVADALKEYWEEVMYPALLKVWEFIKDNVVPIWEKLVLFFQEDVARALAEMRRLWEEVVYPALLMVWEFIQDSVIPIFEVLIEIIEIMLVNAVEYFIEIWNEKFKPMLKALWEFIKEKVIPILESMWSWIKEKLGVAIEWLTETVLPPLVRAFEILKGILEKVHKWLEMVRDVLKSIKIPRDLEEHSPSALEQSFQNAANIMKQLAEVELPKLAASFNMLGTAAAPVTGAVGGGGGDTYTTTYNNYLTTTTPMTSGTLAMEFADMTMATR